MRILFRIIPLCMLLFSFMACDDDEEVKVETVLPTHIEVEEMLF